jgi:signal transduction histidine kinase
MEKIIWKFFDSFDLRKQARELDLRVWQTPGFMFVLMGLIIILTMTIVYFVSRKYDDPQVLIIAEVLVVVVLLTIGNSIIQNIEQMARINKMKSEFISIASHQFKTPLSQISWEVELLVSKNKEGLNGKQIELLNNIEKSNSVLKRLVNDLLDVSRIDQGRLVLLKENFDISNIIQQIVEENELLARAKGIKIDVKMDNFAKIIMGDHRKIGVAIGNLVSNSIKYIGKNGRIEIGTIKEGENLLAWVRDNGVGIPEEEQHNIFQKFFRSGNVAKYETDGTGLGLYISKNIIEQSGGKIWFESKEGVGTTFYLSLPLVRKA